VVEHGVELGKRRWLGFLFQNRPRFASFQCLMDFLSVSCGAEELGIRVGQNSGTENKNYSRTVEGSCRPQVKRKCRVRRSGGYAATSSTNRVNEETERALFFQGLAGGR